MCFKTVSQLKLNNETVLGNIEEGMLQNVQNIITHGTILQREDMIPFLTLIVKVLYSDYFLRT